MGGLLTIVLVLVKELIDKDRLDGYGEFLCGFAQDKHSSIKRVDFVSNVCFRRGIPFFQCVDIRITVEMERLEHWVRISGTFTLGVHA